MHKFGSSAKRIDRNYERVQHTGRVVTTWVEDLRTSELRHAFALMNVPDQSSNGLSGLYEATHSVTAHMLRHSGLTPCNDIKRAAPKGWHVHVENNLVGPRQVTRNTAKALF